MWARIAVVAVAAVVAGSPAAARPDAARPPMTCPQFLGVVELKFGKWGGANATLKREEVFALALNHCFLSRAELRTALPDVLVPEDGETIEL